MFKCEISMANIGKYNFVIQSNECDLNSQAKICFLAENLLLCAGKNASENGFSLEKLQENGRAWVLSRFEMKFEKIPKINDEIIVETWIEDVEKFTTQRRFIIYDAQNNIIGMGASVWVIINLISRRIIDLSIEPNIKNMILKRSFSQKNPEKIDILNTILIETHKIKYSDIDINLHVNSIKYIQMTIDTIPLERHKEVSVSGFSVNYVNETMYGDVISIEKEIGDREAFELKRKDEKTACKIVLY